MTLLPARSMVVAPAGTLVRAVSPTALDVAALDDDRLIRAGRCAGAVDDADVGQRYDGRIDLNVAADRVAELRLGGQPDRERWHHGERRIQSSNHQGRLRQEGDFSVHHFSRGAGRHRARSVVAKDDQRIDACGAARWHVAGQEGHDQHDDGNGGIGGRIHRPDTVQFAREPARSDRRSDHADDNARRAEDRAILQYEPEDIAALRAKGEADAEVTRSSRHEEREHAVNTDAAENERETRHRYQQRCRGGGRGSRTRNDRRHRSHVVDDHVPIDAGD